MQLSQTAKRSELHPDYAAIGNLHEELHAAEHPEAQREVPFRRDVSATSLLSGRADFVFPDRVDECKATFSKTTISNAKSGKPEMSHLTQLVCYLMEFGLSRGRIVYGYFERAKTGGLVRKDTAVVEVEVGARPKFNVFDGQVFVCGQPSGYTTADLVNSMHQIDKWMHTTQLAPRPTANGFMSACKFCPCRELCDRAEAEDLLTKDIVDEAVELIEAQVGPTPKITKEK